MLELILLMDVLISSQIFVSWERLCALDMERFISPEVVHQYILYLLYRVLWRVLERIQSLEMSLKWCSQKKWIFIYCIKWTIIHSFICLSNIYPTIVYLSIYLSICLSICLSIYPLIYSSFYSSTYMYLSIYISIHHLSIHPCMYLSTHSSLVSTT